MRKLFLIWIVIAVISGYLLYNNPPSNWLPPSSYPDNETLSIKDDNSLLTVFSSVDFLPDNDIHSSVSSNIKPAEKKQSDETVFEESFENDKNSYWTGEYVHLNGKNIFSLSAIENKYFGVGASYQPPNAIGYFDNNMELSFSYYTGNTPYIYISFHNDTKNDNYHYEWKNIIPHSWETATVPLRWFRDNEHTGKPLDDGDVISRLNFYAGSPAIKPIVYIDNVKLTIKPPQNIQSGLQEQHNEFKEDFETASRNWHGIRTAELPGKRSGSAIKAIPADDKWFGVTAKHEADSQIFTIDKNPFISLSYYIEENENIYVSVYNKTKGDNYHYWIKNPTVGSWQSFSKSFLFFTDNSYKGIPVSSGDVLTSIRIFAGKPGKMVNLWIDDIKLEAKDIQPAIEFELRQRTLAPYTKINSGIIHRLRQIYNPNNRKKSIMNLGDSISESMAFVWPMKFAQQGMHANEGYYYFEKSISAKQSQKSSWGKQKINTLLEQLKPETVTILFGTNDILLGGNPGSYLANMEYIVDRCIEAGSIPILLTIPPVTTKSLDNVRLYNSQLQQLAFEKQIPVVDVFQLFIDRKDWKSLLFDGVHPNFFDDGRTGGYNLINNAIFEMYKILEKEVMQRPNSKHSFIPRTFDKCYTDNSQIIFSYDFDRGSQGWSGSHAKTSPDGKKNGCLQLQGATQLAAIANIEFNVKPTTYIALSVYAENCQRFRVQIFNRTNKDNFWAAREKLPQKQWIRYYFDLNSEFQDNENKNKHIFFEDQIGNIQIYGDVIDSSSRLYIDGVIVYHATPQSFTATLKKQFEDMESEYETIRTGLSESCPMLDRLIKLRNEFMQNSNDSPNALKTVFDNYKITLQNALLYTQTQSVFNIPEPRFAVGIDSAMRRISAYHSHYPFEGRIADTITIFAAQNEYEHVQLYLIPFTGQLNNVNITLSDAHNENSLATIDKNHFSWFIQGYVTTQRSWPITARQLGTKPDPLLPGNQFNLIDPQPLLLRLHIPPKTLHGTYNATVSIDTDDSTPITIQLNIIVWRFAIPATGTLYTPTTLDFSNVEKYYNKKIDTDTRRKWYSFCLDHRIDPTNLYYFGISPVQSDIDYCIQRGLRTIIIGGNHYSETIKNQDFVQSAYKFCKSAGLLDKTMIYIGDEPYTNQTALDNIRRKAQWVRENCPGLKTFAGTYPIEQLHEYIDVWDPQIDEFNIQHAQQRKDAGDEIMWYVAAAPSFPYPNVQIDNDLIEARVLFWITYAYGVQGFEYYYINLWGNNIYGRGEKKWPDVPWNTYTFYSSRNNYNGDGQLIYPGKNMEPYGSLRLIAIQDGIEDYEMLVLLKDCVNKAKKMPHSSQLEDLIEQAERIIDILDFMVCDTVNYNRDPDTLQEFRIKAGSVLDSLYKLMEE
ncbi:MAG: GDSL-type esterase/lipase family protein [Candidatus Auribacterota bacterium]|jgi:hypothetical protein|nr:GDSL-type esterase/lipase family protein [Candidatus Auribacterota bacterium]